jgi:hypothetical protein
MAVESTSLAESLETIMADQQLSIMSSIVTSNGSQLTPWYLSAVRLVKRYLSHASDDMEPNLMLRRLAQAQLFDHLGASRSVAHVKILLQEKSKTTSLILSQSKLAYVGVASAFMHTIAGCLRHGYPGWPFQVHHRRQGFIV